MTQFENDYADLKQRNTILHEELKSLRSENTHIKKSEHALAKEKQEKEQEMLTRVEQLREEITRLRMDISDYKEGNED